MSDSESASDFKPDSDSRVSTDEDVRHNSRRSSQLLSSPRKRRRSTDTLPNSKRQLAGQYNDRYRLLYNEEVVAAATRFNCDAPLHPHSRAQIGASIWTRDEKTKFFAALERLGKDNIPGISRAIGTKSIPEVREFALLLQDAAGKANLHADAKATLRDIPAAIEISSDCNQQLELAGDTLAMFQERFEAKLERGRYGDYWLITPEVAQEIENIANPSRAPSTASSPPPIFDDEQQVSSVDIDTADPPILRNIPEAKLLIPSVMLQLSASLFMNGSDTPPSRQPHWSTFGSEIASEPSIYRTAFNDFHNLALSLTKRLMQASLIQATSRVRSQDWRGEHRVQPMVKRRDVHAAVDMLHLPRDSQAWWRTMARRCGLRVFDYKKKRETSWQNERYLSWNEVEELMDEGARRSRSADGTIRGPTSRPEDEDFRARARRSGTPLPQELIPISDTETEIDSDQEWEEEGPAADNLLDDLNSQTYTHGDRVSPEPERDVPGVTRTTLEEFDYEASRQEELKLWEILGADPPVGKADSPKQEHEIGGSDVESSFAADDNWREWTRYRAEWEEFDTPVPAAGFQANRKPNDPSAPLSASDLDVESGLEELQKRKKSSATDIPVRGARAYAALQDRLAASEDRNLQAEDTDDDADFPAPSIEEVIGIYVGVSRGGDADINDTKPASESDDD